MTETLDVLCFDMNNVGGVQCVAIAKSEKSRQQLHERGDVDLFTPEEHGINCWILIQEQSEVRP